MNAPNGIEIRAYRDEDEPGVLSLLQDTLAGGPTGSRTPAFFRWKHLDNHFGRSIGLVAADGPRLVGVRLFMRWQFRSGDTPVTAVRAVDTATHPSHQGKGIFRNLTLAGLEEARRDTALVFNTPNENSLPGYLKMGWSQVARVPVRIGIGNPRRFLAGLRSSRRTPTGQDRALSIDLPQAQDVLGDCDGLASLLTELGDYAQRDRRLTTSRTADYLRWRYSSAPDLDYRALSVQRGSDVIGVAIGRVRHRGTLQEITLGELLVRPGDRDTARYLLRRVARCGADHVTAHFAAGTESLAIARRAGYISVPQRGITLVANALQPVPVNPTRGDSWKLSLGDLELF